MIVRITRGSGMTGLVQYLAGPGKRNEHTDPHLVAGDGAVMAWSDDSELNRPAAARIGAHLDGARRATGTEVSGGHVWHASLALPAGDGRLSDETWAAITTEFVESMGFGDSGGKAGCRWAAVRHGVSAGGNDHVHVVVSLVREDGTKADTWRDYARASTAAQELEVRHGLTVIESRGLGRGSVGVTGAEHNKAARLGHPEPARATLARTVRAVAVASRDEAGFVGAVRDAGLLVRPRYAAGGTAAVVGYSVAVRPVAGEPVVWFGGGRLDRDLTLPRLREAWPDTPQDAVGVWAGRAHPAEPLVPASQLATAVGAAGVGGAVSPGPVGERGSVDFPLPVPRARPVVDPEWAATRQILEGLRRDGRAREVGDTAGWARSARDTAGLFAAMSARVEGAAPGPLARTADQLARVAQHRAGRSRAWPRAGGGGDGVARAARYLMRTAGESGESGEDRERREREVELLQAMIVLAGAVGAALEASADRRQSRALLATVTRDLADTYAEELTAARARAMARIHTTLDQRRAARPAPAAGQSSGYRPTPPPPTQSPGRGRGR